MLDTKRSAVAEVRMSKVVESQMTMAYRLVSRSKSFRNYDSDTKVYFCPIPLLFRGRESIKFVKYSES